MSYEYVVVPAGVVASAVEVPSYFRSQQGRPVDDDLRIVVLAGLAAWNAALPASRPHAAVRIEAAGDAVRVTAADDLDRRRTRGSAVDYAAGPVRQLLEDLITGFDYELYDGRQRTLTPAPGFRVVDVDIGGERSYRSMTKSQLLSWITNLAQLAATPFLIVSRPDDRETFIQTYRDGSMAYTLEIHDSAHTDHFFAAAFSDSSLVARLIWEWANDDWSTLDRVEWIREEK
ncbi:hypothetical protein APR12_000036 [Nocardia amikacinitolerans]|uniref:hypothetical protein n=1 Tax=Nocardia amikacinitolerans TaxID=756689 RepID=UPI0008371678|nr:hypothetical protein [Nocardia amikacinitolerans]MCP2314706.1 hypothetical protein [Nocardia amikacinitolerans]